MNNRYKEKYTALVEQIKTAFSTLEKNHDNREALKQQISAFKTFQQDPQLTLALCNDEETYNSLAQLQQAMLLSVQPAAMMKMAKSKKLIGMDTPNLSLLVASYAINVSALYAGYWAVDSAWNDAVASTAMRQAICLEIAEQSELVKKLYPAARMLLFAFLKKDPIIPELSYFRSNLKQDVQDAIDSAYDIRTDYNPDHEDWNKILWPATVGFGVGDYIGRISELWDCALHENKQYIESKDDPKANAELLVSDPRLSDYISKRFTRYPDYNIRLKLAEKYPHITRLLLQHPGYRGYEGEITSTQLKTLAQKHDCMDLFSQSDLAASSSRSDAQLLSQFGALSAVTTRDEPKLSTPTAKF